MPEPITGVRIFAGTAQSGPDHYREPAAVLRVGARYRITTEHEGELRQLDRDSDGSNVGALRFVLLTDAGRIGGVVNVERQKWELLAPIRLWTEGDLAVAQSPDEHGAASRRVVRYGGAGAWINLLSGVALGNPDEWDLTPIDEYEPRR